MGLKDFILEKWKGSPYPINPAFCSRLTQNCDMCKTFAPRLAPCLREQLKKESRLSEAAMFTGRTKE